MENLKSPIELRREIESNKKEQKEYSKIKFQQSNVGKAFKETSKFLAPSRIDSRNIAMMQRTPQIILTKEQNILSELFGQKKQFWGNGQPVQISNTLTSGNGLLKTGSGDATRRLMF
jgi:hypothetical protein